MGENRKTPKKTVIWEGKFVRIAFDEVVFNATKQKIVNTFFTLVFCPTISELCFRTCNHKNTSDEQKAY
jgi:hypothetical protein